MFKPENMIGYVYRHYKGNYYHVINIGKHTETEEMMVVYHDINHQVWVRPLVMFNNFIGDGIKRFTFVGPYSKYYSYFKK
jgi:hypothetical protein